MKARRVQNYLDPLTTAPKRRFFCAVDIESKDGDSQAPGFTRPFLVGVFDPFRSVYEEFRDEPHLASRSWEDRGCLPGGCVDKTMQFLLSVHFNQYQIYAHNGGSFDHLFWLKWLRDHEDEFGFEVIPVQSSIQAMRVWRLPEDPEDPIRERWTFLDSMKLLPMGLDRACRTFGIQGKVEHDLAMHESDPRWSEYLKRDCVALSEVMLRTHKLVEDKLGGEVGMTTPATSMKLYRRRFLGRGSSPKKIPRHIHFVGCADRTCLGCCHAWVRRGYYGGRTELFETYGERLKYYDFNSSYVASMRDPGGMPAGDRTVQEGKLDWRLYKTHAGFAECTVHVPETCKIPPLPYRDKKTGKLLFPVGRFSGVWSCEELKLLEDPIVGGTILKIEKAVWYRRKHLFDEMVDELWKLRDRTLDGYDEGLSLLAKLLGNGLYGKFGMQEERTSIVIRGRGAAKGRCLLCAESVEEDVELCKACEGSAPASDDEEVWYKKNRVDASYIIPQIAAHITALARVRLWNAMKIVHEKGGRLFYCDSVTGDRTTIVNGPNGIDIFTLEELWSMGQQKLSDRGKEFASLLGYSAWTQKDGKSGWFPIKRIIRHKAGKGTWRITTKHGQTQVTTDHGIVVDGRTTSPSEFVENASRFTVVEAPRLIGADVVDLYDCVKNFEHRQILADENYVFVRHHKGYHGNSIAPLRVRRYYRRGSEEWKALLRLVGIYVGDGSSTIAGVTTRVDKNVLSFCKSHRDTMEEVKKDLLTIFPEMNVFGPYWSDTVFIVRSATTTAACVFAAMAGYGCKGKKFPSFCYSLDEESFKVLMGALEKGDGQIDVAGQFVYTTTSQKLAAGLSMMLSQHGIEHSFYFRRSKEAWILRTRPSGSERNRCKINSEVFEAVPEEYVYDLSVDGAHTFVDGIGRVLLHNTDSILCDVEIPTGTELGALKDEYPTTTLKALFLQPKAYLIETLEDDERLPGVHVKDCQGEGCKGCAKGKVTLKGFPKKLRTKENLFAMRDAQEKRARGEPLADGEGQVSYMNLEKIRTLAKLGFKRGPRMHEVKKSFRSRYDKRQLLPDGTTRAVTIYEDEAEELAAEE